MPKIYEFKGFHFFFYSREHNPPHCHVKKAGREAKIELFNIGGVVMYEIKQITRLKFAGSEIMIIEDFTRIYGDRMIQKWNIFFNGKKPKCEKISRLKKEGKA